MLCEKILILLQREKIKIDNLGRWVGFVLDNRRKKLPVIAICRILQGINQGIYVVISQHNQMRRKVATVTEYRK